MQRKPTSYEVRGRVLRERSKRGDKKAMEELYNRYHINEIMVNGELVNLPEVNVGPDGVAIGIGTDRRKCLLSG